MVCRTRPAGSATGHDPARAGAVMPSQHVLAYNRFQAPTRIQESGTGADSATVTRTTTTTYDAANRVTAVAVAGTGAGAGQALPTTHTLYDPTTGRVTAIRSVNAAGAEVDRISRQYDALGRVTKYTDSTGAWSVTAYDRFDKPATVTTSIGTTTTYTYDRTKDPRGYLTSMTDSDAGTFEATWGPDGQLQTEVMPGGVRLDITYDAARVPTARTYTRVSDGEVIATDSVVENHRGQWLSHTTPTGTTAYAYDRAGRLTDAKDTVNRTNTCTWRSYGFDDRGNRTTARTTTTPGTLCDRTTAATDITVTTLNDTANRLRSTSTDTAPWVYDALGRTTSFPAADGTGAVSNTFYVNDLIARQEQPGKAKLSWTLDPALRRTIATRQNWNGTGWIPGTTSISHYTGDSDNPSWITTRDSQGSTVTRNITGMTGELAMMTSSTGTGTLMLADLHGDITTTIPLAAGATQATWDELQHHRADEFGNPIALTTGQPATTAGRYGWLGAHQRSTDTLGGLTLMGVRLYHPGTGRFLSVDPVPGGNTTAYNYPQDPINSLDLNGQYAIPVIPVVALLAAAVAVAAYLLMKEMIRACTTGNCPITIPIPSITISFPSATTTTARKYNRTPYTVYRIDGPAGETWKYGISRVGMQRANRQLGVCSAAYGGQRCTARRVAIVQGWFTARTLEANLISSYRKRHGHCPPGQVLSCR